MSNHPPIANRNADHSTSKLAKRTHQIPLLSLRRLPRLHIMCLRSTHHHDDRSASTPPEQNARAGQPTECATTDATRTRLMVQRSTIRIHRFANSSSTPKGRRFLQPRRIRVRLFTCQRAIMHRRWEGRCRTHLRATRAYTSPSRRQPPTGRKIQTTEVSPAPNRSPCRNLPQTPGIQGSCPADAPPAPVIHPSDDALPTAPPVGG